MTFVHALRIKPRHLLSNARNADYTDAERLEVALCEAPLLAVRRCKHDVTCVNGNEA